MKITKMTRSSLHLLIAFTGLSFLLLSLTQGHAEKTAGETQPFSKEQLDQLQKDGQKLASEKCASCHAIQKTGDSLNKEAPPFRTFASKWPLESLEESLAEGIVTGHADMPEVVFNPEEITAFLEFLRTLQSK